MSKVINFPQEEILDVGIAIERTEEFFEIALKVSEFIKTLPLNTAQNDELVKLVIDQIQEGERGAYLQGFRMGIEFKEYTGKLN
jgi:hypothetical protein